MLTSEVGKPKEGEILVDVPTESVTRCSQRQEAEFADAAEFAGLLSLWALTLQARGVFSPIQSRESWTRRSELPHSVRTSALLRHINARRRHHAIAHFAQN